MSNNIITECQILWHKCYAKWPIWYDTRCNITMNYCILKNHWCSVLALNALTLLVGWQEGYPTCKNMEWWGSGVVICLEWGANDLHTVQLMPPHHLLLQQNLEWFFLLVLDYLGCSGKKAIKRLCVCVQYFICNINTLKYAYFSENIYV